MRRELSASTRSHEHELEVTPLGERRFAVVIDGRALEVDAVEVRPGTWSLVIDGRSRLVDLDRTGGKLSLATTAGATAVELEDARRRRLARATAAGRPKVAGEELRAPIAGRVVKVLVAVGDVVAPGDGVVVLEAMKMENELKAERGGTVSAVQAEPGQSVDTGAPLVTLS
jgi:biotin carboxyl carrier protein